jgi:predicted phage terminase large subunit-like protein
MAEFRPARHHRLLIDRLQAVADGEIKRLMIFMPPGSAKSTYANVWYAPWWMGRNPQGTVITGSYGQELADKWGRRSRNIVGSAEYRRIFGTGLDAGSAAANRWATDSGGEYLAVGVGGPVTGNRADLAIIDDPVKGREEADSQTIRDKTRDWYRDDLWTRLKPGAAIVLIMTRWHEDDLAGWLLEEANHGGEQWDVLSLPMVAEADDALGRDPGERLWADWFTDAMVDEARRDARRWNALYQQRPAPEEGDYFRAAWLKSYDKPPPRETLRVYGASDYAVTDDGGDYTVHAVVGVDPEWNMYLLDLWRDQTASDVWVESFCDLVRRWKPLEWAEETGQIKAGVGPFLTRRQIERQAYVARRAFPTRSDKSIRAQSIRGRMAQHGLYLPVNAQWAAEFRRELLTFPAGKHDDQVDAIGLIGQLLDHVMAGKKPEEPRKTRWHYEAKGNRIVGNVPIRELIKMQERRRAGD